MKTNYKEEWIVLFNSIALLVVISLIVFGFPALWNYLASVWNTK